jgi:magnesium transporter
VSQPVEEEPGSLALSELESLAVLDADGDEIGELADVLVLFASDSPPITGILVERDDEQYRATWDDVREIDVDEDRIRLGVRLDDLSPASLRHDEIALVDSVLDNQVLDVRRRKFVRVQDVVLTPRDGDLVVAGVDASSHALARRIGLGFISRRLARRPGDFVPWEDVNLVSVRLSRLNFVEAFAELAELHPADLADVVSQVGPRERAAVLGALNTQLAADTLQEMEPELRSDALAEMPVERAVAVLAEIDPDEGADLLAELPDGLAETLLAALPKETERALRGLASHPEHSAGALMTTDLMTIPGDVTVAGALARLRAEQPERHATTCLFVVDADQRLTGLVTLHDLVLAEPGQVVAEIMDDDVVDATADLDEEEVGRRMTKYNLLVLPVVDAERRVVGVVTLDDALEAIVPEEWKRRLPRIFR